MMVRPFYLFIALAALAMMPGGCAPPPPAADQQTQQIQQGFDGFKDALSLAHAHEALNFVDKPSRDYLQQVAMSTPDAADPELVQLIRQSVAKITPGGIQPGFTVEKPLQRVLDAGWITPADLGAITIGPVTLAPDGAHAHAEIFWQGTATTFQAIFAREGDAWKIDLLNLLPYAQAALAMDRTVKNETETQQVDRLVRQVPNP
jgi:hypothetical protein